MDIVARSATASEPSWKTCGLPLTRSVATQRKGTGSVSNEGTSSYDSVTRSISNPIWCPAFNPAGKGNPSRVSEFAHFRAAVWIVLAGGIERGAPDRIAD